MSLVKYPLAACLARPDDEAGRRYPLVEHLEAVAWVMGRPDGTYAQRLRFLAGLLHDAGKALPEWQDYIRLPEGERTSGRPHAFAGSMLFALAFGDLLSVWGVGRREKNFLAYLGLSLISIVYHHHAEVPNLFQDLPPWQATFSPKELLGCDLPGLMALVVKYFPELARLKDELASGRYELAFASLAAAWPGWQNLALRYVASQQAANVYADSARLCLSTLATNHGLIAGDRFHAAGLPVPLPAATGVSPAEASEARQRLEIFCTGRQEHLQAKGADKRLLAKREACRQAALATLRREGENYRFYTLELPTGYGKTLTAVSLALEAIAQGWCRRAIYVAPYLSILSQAAAEIAAATGLEVLVHHHLSALERYRPEGEEGEGEGEREGILHDSWLAPVVATTYNQFFRALFPARSQHTLRLGGLREAWVIVDEPQTMAAPSWNPFLAMLEAACAEFGCRVLFVTATMPELGGGLMEASALSLGREQPLFSRYRVRYLGQLAEDGVASQAVAAYQEHGAVAVILNTIKDAAEVYVRIKEELARKGLPEQDLYFLSGRLTPLHKRQRIRQIGSALEAGKGALVVCTQVLEAGVDLSFRVVLRALPVLPSLVQAAGRCNRHGEGEPGEVMVFDFRRAGEEDTRRFVYRDPVQREVTNDILLGGHPAFEEAEAGAVVSSFYRECFRRNTNRATLEKIVQAANGHWRELADLAPFGAEMPEYGIFVPLAWEMPEPVARGMRHFGIRSPEELWEHYVARGFLASLGPEERRRFMALMYQFMVQVPRDVAEEVGSPAKGRAILRLRYPSRYQEDIGLSLVPTEEAYEEQFI